MNESAFLTDMLARKKIDGQEPLARKDIDGLQGR